MRLDSSDCAGRIIALSRLPIFPRMSPLTLARPLTLFPKRSRTAEAIRNIDGRFKREPVDSRSSETCRENCCGRGVMASEDPMSLTAPTSSASVGSTTGASSNGWWTFHTTGGGLRLPSTVSGAAALRNTPASSTMFNFHGFTTAFDVSSAAAAFRSRVISYDSNLCSLCKVSTALPARSSARRASSAEKPLIARASRALLLRKAPEIGGGGAASGR
mmetsp:Transcript_23553/g.68154  ORF Transcript_23553/g.68154 Transcript_23553/m.68154 type:complete len:217 (+) Transcript_23553:866-1516(+)